MYVYLYVCRCVSIHGSRYSYVNAYECMIAGLYVGSQVIMSIGMSVCVCVCMYLCEQVN